MNLTGQTRLFAVLGHPIRHSLSPLMHNAAIAKLGIDAAYIAFDVAPGDLPGLLPAFRTLGFGGLNLTIPLKEVAFRALPLLDASAADLGAVNTIKFLGDGRMEGHNTDGHGFLASIRETFGIGPHGRGVFVLGCGGAGRAVAITCARHGATAFVLYDTDGARVDRLATELRAVAPAARVAALRTPDDPAPRDCELVVQATPLGMKRGECPPVYDVWFRPGQFVYDLVYMYPETDFMARARAAGAQVSNGIGMLAHQGARSFEIWTGTYPPVAVMQAALESKVYHA